MTVDYDKHLSKVTLIRNDYVESTMVSKIPDKPKEKNLKLVTVQLLVSVDNERLDETVLRDTVKEMCNDSSQRLQFYRYSVGNSGMTQSEYDDSE